MKQWHPKFFLSDGKRILLLASMICLLCLCGLKLNQVVSAHILRADAQSTVGDWTNTLLATTNIIPALSAGKIPSDKTGHLLEDATKVGGIYRYEIWDRSGRVVYLSERMTSLPESKAERDIQWAGMAPSILLGESFAKISEGKASENPAHFVECYLPIKYQGAVIGAFDVSIDQTADYAIYRRALFFAEIIMGIAVLLAGGIPGFMVYRKMRDNRKAQADALFLAEHDNLTGLANRKMLAETARVALALTRRKDICVAALVIDLDRFKEVNDTFGHAIGDEVLKIVASRLSSLALPTDMVGRQGSDEFVILQIGMRQPQGATALASALLKNLSKPYVIDGLQVAMGVSIGVALSHSDTEDWAGLLFRADMALHKAKGKDRGTVSFFETGMDAIFRERGHLEAEIRRAMDTNEFHLAYQPLINFKRGELIGFEALLRWPEGWDSQSPAAFIPVAEETGLIVPIGAWVLKTACREAASWAKPLKVAINLSPVQFTQGDIVATVKEALLLSGLDPALLELEVTESLLLQNSETVLDQLSQLRAIGISIALDDFGTGYSSLSYLWKFPFDKVKVDQSFVMQMEEDPKAAAIVDTVVALGRTLGLTVIAEGVETKKQAEALKKAGCDQGQGYLFGRPLSAEAAVEMIASGSLMVGA